MNPPQSLRARVLASAAATPSWSRKEGRRAALLLSVASITIAVLLFQLAGGLDHSAGRPLAITLGLVGGWSLVSAFVTWLAIGRGGSTLSRRPALLVASAVFVPLALLLWMHTFHGTYEEPFARIGYRCAALTLAIAATPLGAFLRLRRGVEPRLPMALGAAAGAACGACATVVVDAWCPLTNARHVAVGHVGPLIVLIVVGAVLGTRLLGPRRLPR
jgi:hypothetical protein